MMRTPGFPATRGLIQKFIDAFSRLFHRASDYIDFVGEGSSLGCDFTVTPGEYCAGCDAFFAPASSSMMERMSSERNFHAQRPGFHFGSARVNSAQHHRRRKSAHADSCAGHQTFGLHWLFYGRDRRAQILLRGLQMLHHRGVSFLACISASFRRRSLRLF